MFCQFTAANIPGATLCRTILIMCLTAIVVATVDERTTAIQGEEALDRSLTAAEKKLAMLLGAQTPAPERLWPGRPPQMAATDVEETVDDQARIRGVSQPSITIYPAAAADRPTLAMIVCPGGGYGGLDWRTHVVYAAKAMNPLGVTIVGLKYRVRPPNGTTNDEIRALALLDAQRAVRLVRHRARAWNIDPHQLGIAGYSAGGNLAMNLATQFDAGDPTASDPIERESSRPDFAIGLATWHWRQKESPFRFPRDAPPVFLVHATNDGLAGGAPIELPRAIERDLRALGVPVELAVYEQGAHGVGNLIPQRVKNGFPPAQWPQRFLQWYRALEPTRGTKSQ